MRPPGGLEGYHGLVEQADYLAPPYLVDEKAASASGCIDRSGLEIPRRHPTPSSVRKTWFGFTNIGNQNHEETITHPMAKPTP
jgi:hypothetical protein